MIQASDVEREEPQPDAQIAKKTKRYPSDLTDEEWAQIAPLMPAPGRRGRPLRRKLALPSSPQGNVWSK